MVPAPRSSEPLGAAWTCCGAVQVVVIALMIGSLWFDLDVTALNARSFTAVRPTRTSLLASQPLHTPAQALVSSYTFCRGAQLRQACSCQPDSDRIAVFIALQTADEAAGFVHEHHVPGARCDATAECCDNEQARVLQAAGQPLLCAMYVPTDGQQPVNGRVHLREGEVCPGRTHTAMAGLGLQVATPQHTLSCNGRVHVSSTRRDPPDCISVRASQSFGDSLASTFLMRACVCCDMCTVSAFSLRRKRSYLIQLMLSSHSFSSWSARSPSTQNGVYRSDHGQMSNFHCQPSQIRV